MTLSIKALLPETEVRKVNPNKAHKSEEGKDAGKGPRKARAPREDDDGLREWKDDSNGGASIADLLGNLEE